MVEWCQIEKRRKIPGVNHRWVEDGIREGFKDHSVESTGSSRGVSTATKFSKVTMVAGYAQFSAVVSQGKGNLERRRLLSGRLYRSVLWLGNFG